MDLYALIKSASMTVSRLIETILLVKKHSVYAFQMGKPRQEDHGSILFRGHTGTEWSRFPLLFKFRGYLLEYRILIDDLFLVFRTAPGINDVI
jgi:hypothetical protein